MITETHKNVPYVYVENEFGFELNAVTVQIMRLIFTDQQRAVPCGGWQVSVIFD